jgi:hypothetical protein
MKSVVAAFLIFASLTACTHLSTGQGGNAADTVAILAPDLRLDLPEPAAMGRSIEAVQMVSAHRDGKTMVFEAHLSITPERVLLVGVDPTGQRLMTVTWRGTGITVEKSPFLPKEVQPGAMLADLVALYWPEDVVRQVLAKSGATLTADAAGRQVLLHGKPVLQATYQNGSSDPWKGGLHYRNLAWGYDIDVQTLQVSK